MTRVFAIRPEPGLSATIETGEALGLQISGYSLSHVEPVEWHCPAETSFDGLLVGSANAFRFAGPQLRKLVDLPVLAVGKITADMAQVHGFAVEKIGEGGLQSLLDALPDSPRHLLRLTGERNVALNPPPGVSISEQVVYRTLELPMPREFARELADKSLVLLHSAGSAAHFAAECDRLGLAREMIALAAMGPRILAATGHGWAEARSAVNPRETALLALAREMCH
ncbi:uroporphyrinogen-III synthase [Altererythrobacter arenosus]|uniref:Uroporphyrinogen-III synthase n=1 Tax=Altererythrobacter arenosus TaxID=3032592 RepID=A0ABY8FNK4_9SPHN|nr:uroporphyrinogen-III synthase [Altererythrobacter sp. CAU 1644]WFL76442.1 uroporphyrinogen-III synthase [Altererythrobacter sp. CAU 1644]